jgi:secondary thiamine-phosphate synthase enzyme
MAGVLLGGAGCSGGTKNVRNFCDGVVVAQLVRKAAAVRIHTRPEMAPGIRILLRCEFSRLPTAGVNWPFYLGVLRARGYRRPRAGATLESMKSYRKELWFEVPTRRAFVNITRQVEACLEESGVQEGLVLVNAMHITASVFINDDESGLHQDYEQWLEQLAPHEPVSQYRHNRTGEDNADAHLKRQVMGREVVVAITKGKLDFGPWEQIFYGEFDGRRKKRALVKVIGE